MEWHNGSECSMTIGDVSGLEVVVHPMVMEKC